MPRKAKIITAVVAEGVERKYLDRWTCAPGKKE